MHKKSFPCVHKAPIGSYVLNRGVIADSYWSRGLVLCVLTRESKT